MRLEIAQGVVTALNQANIGAAIMRRHFMPVQHFVPLGNNGKIVFGGFEGTALQDTQFIDKTGLEEKAFMGVVPGCLLANVTAQVACRLDGGIENHRLAGQSLSYGSGVKAPQRGADDSQSFKAGFLLPSGQAGENLLHGLPG